MKNFTYFKDCRGLDRDEAEHLEQCTDQTKEISFWHFTRMIGGVEVFYNVLGDSRPFTHDNGERHYHISRDWSMGGAHSSMFNGKKCYYFQHSHIEYIWLEEI